MHRYSSSGTVGDNLREFRGKASDIQSSLRQAATELASVEDAIAYVIEANRNDTEEVASAKFNLGQVALQLEGDVAKFQKLVDDAKRIAGAKYLKNAAQPVVMQD